MEQNELQALVDDSGLSVSEFAKCVMGRSPRTLRRWLDGSTPIPPDAERYLERLASVRITPVAVITDVTR